MSVLDSFWAVPTTNWANWIFTTFITLFGAYVGIRYQSRKQASIDEKEREQAKDEIINMMEERLINEKEISESWIQNLITASEQKNDIRKLDQLSPISLMQELMFDIEESSHLDPKQKERYVDVIDETIDDLENSKRMSRMSDSYSDLLEDIRREISDENKKALKLLQKLEGKVVKEPPEQRTQEYNSASIERAFSALIGAITSGLFAYILVEILSTMDMSVFLNTFTDGLMILPVSLLVILIFMISRTIFVEV